jgi:hypothetical protein
MYVDDRNEEQMVSHPWIVGGRDKCLSGWGGAEGGNSYAYWACKPEDLSTVEQWVKGRKDLTRVTRLKRVSSRSQRCPNHVHVYVVDKWHPALERG